MNYKNSSNTSTLLLRLMYQTESLLKWNFGKLQNLYPLEDSSQNAMQEAEIIAALSSVRAYGRLLEFLSNELNHILEGRKKTLTREIA